MIFLFEKRSVTAMKFKRISALILSAAVFSGNSSIYAERTDVMNRLFSGLGDISADEPYGRLPYNDGTMLSEYKEPMTVGKSAARIFGEENASGGDLSWKSKNVFFNLGGKTVSAGGKSYSLSSKISLIKAYEADFDGDGKKDEMAAVIGAKTTGGIPLLLLCVSDMSYSGAAKVLYEGSTGVNGNLFLDSAEWSGAISMVCADINGDGIDEIVTNSPTSGSTPAGDYNFDRQSSSYVWYMEEQAAELKDVKWSAEPFNLANGLRTWAYSDCYFGAPGVTSSLAAADINGDGCDDIIAAVSATNAGLSSGRDNSFSLMIINGAAEFDNMRMPENRKHMKYLITGDDANNIFLDATRGDASAFDVKAEDIDGSGTPTVFLSIKHSINRYAAYSGDKTYTPDFFVYALDYNRNTNHYTSSLVYKGGIYHHGWVDSSKYSDRGYVFKTRRNDCAPIRIGILHDDFGMSAGKTGYVSSGTLLVDQKYISFVRYPNGDTYRYETEDKGSYTGVWGTEDEEPLTVAGYEKSKCILYNNGINVTEIRTAKVDDERDAALITAATKDGNRTYFLMSDGAKYPINSDSSILSSDSGEGTLIAMPDTDSDSVRLKYNKHVFFWADPVIIAVLASPPYFEALPNDAYSNGQTTYGKTQSSSSGTSTSFTVGAGAYVSTEVKTGVKGVAGVFETEGEVMKHSNIENEKNVEVSYTQSFSTSGGEDAVVLATVGYDAYSYTAYYPGTDGKETSSPYIVYVPRGGSDAVKMTSISYDDYLALNQYAEYALPNLDEVFTHSIGKPESYPHSEPSGVNIVKGSVMSYPGVSTFPTTTGSHTLSMEITEETTDVTSTGGSVSAKLGGGLEAEADDILGMANVGTQIVVGSVTEKEFENGRIVANAVGTSFEGTVFGQGEGMNVSGTGLAKGDFNWRLLRYVYTNNPGKNKNIVTQEFPVITYITSQNVTQPGGVIPTSVKVTPSAQSVDETGPIKYKNTKNFTVEAAGVSRETRVELDGAPLGMTLEPVSIGSSRAITFGVSIDGNVEAGSYDLKLKVGGVESNTFTLNVNEYSAPVYLGADKKSIDFGSIRYDYSGTKPTCDTQYVTIENISTTQVENLTAELGDGSPFEISEDLSRTTLYANGLANSTATVGIRPKKGLAVGVHNGALTVTNRETSIATTLKVTITEPTLPGEVTFDHMLSVASNPVTVYVTPPKDDGGAKITDYLYTVRNHPDYLDSDGRQVWKSSGISVQSAAYFGLTLRDDLETGKTYEIGVKAVNECGEGAPAWVSVEVDASIPPSEVRNVRVYPGDGCAAVTWDEPDYFGKNLLQPEVTFLNYSVHTYKGYEFVSAEGATGTQYFKSGLENGAEYTFMIQAINMVDTSSFYTDAIVPQSKNSAPVCPNEFKVKTSYKTAELSWSEPIYNGGSAVTKYQVSKDGGATWTDAGTSMSYTFENLTTGVDYTFKVRAVNAVGSGDAAEATCSTPANLGAVNAKINIGYKQLDIEITPDESRKAKGYEIKIDDGEWQRVNTFTFGETEHYLLTDLENGKAYKIYLRGYDDEGIGPERCIERTPSALAPLPLTNLLIEPKNGGFVLSAESGDGSGMYYNVENDGWRYFSDSTREYGLTNGKAYLVALSGLSNGFRTPQYLTVTPDASIPDSPSEPCVTATVGDDFIRFDWTVDNDGGAEISEYRIYSGAEDAAAVVTDKNFITFECSENERSLYSDLYVTAVNSAGESDRARAYLPDMILKGTKNIQLLSGYARTVSEAFSVGMVIMMPNEESGVLEKVFHDMSASADWSVESGSDKISLENRQITVAPGLAAGSYKAVVRADIYGTAFEREVTIGVGNAAVITDASLTDGGVRVAVGFAGSGTYVTIAAAAYTPSGRLAGVSLKRISQKDLSDGMVTLPIESGTGYVKVMLWDGADTMTPLCPSVTAR